MSTVLSLKMAAASWAGAAVDHSTTAAHRATRDIRSVRFMMPSSTAILESVARKGAQINRAPYNVETWNQPGLAPAAKLVKIRNSQLRPMNSPRGGKNSPLPPRKFPAPQGQGIRHKSLELLSQVKSEQRNLRR